jgi:hypothetical protein
MSQLDTSNQFKVRSNGKVVYFDTNTVAPILVKCSPEEAVRLAIWLVAIADPDQKLFRPMFEHIKRT